MGKKLFFYDFIQFLSFLIIFYNFTMKTSKKVAYTVVMGGLTSIACSGCIWQYQRYQQSKERWRVITEEVDNYNPQELSNIPW